VGREAHEYSEKKGRKGGFGSGLVTKGKRCVVVAKGERGGRGVSSRLSPQKKKEGGERTSLNRFRILWGKKPAAIARRTKISQRVTRGGGGEEDPSILHLRERRGEIANLGIEKKRTSFFFVGGRKLVPAGNFIFGGKGMGERDIVSGIGKEGKKISSAIPAAGKKKGGKRGGGKRRGSFQNLR